MGYGRSDGDFISNDWSTAKRGEDYAKTLNEFSPSIMVRARGVRSMYLPKIADINERFARETGDTIGDDVRAFWEGVVRAQDARARSSLNHFF
jgi:hypothetical protein